MLLALALLSVNGVHAANTLQLSSVKGHPGDTVTLSLSLANSDAIVAMQAMVPMGKQLIYLPNSCLLTARGASHQVTAIVLRGTLRIYSYSLSLASYSGNSGVLLNFKVVLGKEPGDYSLPLNKLLLSSAAGASLNATATAGKVTILAPKITLVSNSIDYGHVPIRSVYQRNVTVRNSGNEPLTLSGISFSDNSLSANSVSQVINAGGQATLTLHYAPLVAGAAKFRAVIRSNARVGDSVVNITADPFAVNELRPLNVYGYTDSVATVELRMNNMDSIVAFQTSIKLPQALAYVAGSFVVDSTRSHGHIATAGLCGDTLTLLVTSLNNNPLHGGDGVVARFKLRLHGYGGYALQLIGTMLGDSSGHNVLSAVYTGNVDIYSPYLSCGGSLDLGRSPVTDTVSAKLPIYNSGNAPLVIDRAFFTQGNWHFTNKLPMKIGNYRYDTLQVVCTDTTEGIHTA